MRCRSQSFNTYRAQFNQKNKNENDAYLIFSPILFLFFFFFVVVVIFLLCYFISDVFVLVFIFVSAMLNQCWIAMITNCGMIFYRSNTTWSSFTMDYWPCLWSLMIATEWIASKWFNLIVNRCCITFCFICTWKREHPIIIMEWCLCVYTHVPMFSKQLNPVNFQFITNFLCCLFWQNDCLFKNQLTGGYDFKHSLIWI